MKNESGKNKQRNQHFVPQFYLKNFANEVGGDSISGAILGQKRPLPPISIKTTASETYYYGADLVVENWFKNLEDQWAPLIDDIIKTQMLPTTVDEYMLLIVFAVLSDVRTMKTGDLINKLYNDVRGHILDWNPHLNEKEFGVAYERQFPIELIMSYLLEFMPCFVRQDIRLIVNKTKYSFLTSDNPCVKYNPFFVSRELPYYNYHHRGLVLMIPLSPCLCLCFYDVDAYDIVGAKNQEIIEINNPAQIYELNKLFVRNADRMVYYQNRVDIDDIETLIATCEPHHYEPFIKTSIPVFGIKPESINEHYDFGIFEINPEFVEWGKKRESDVHG